MLTYAGRVVVINKFISGGIIVALVSANILCPNWQLSYCKLYFPNGNYPDPTGYFPAGMEILQHGRTLLGCHLYCFTHVSTYFLFSPTALRRSLKQERKKKLRDIIPIHSVLRVHVP